MRLLGNVTLSTSGTVTFSNLPTTGINFFILIYSVKKWNDGAGLTVMDIGINGSYSISGGKRILNGGVDTTANPSMTGDLSGRSAPSIGELIIEAGGLTSADPVFIGTYASPNADGNSPFVGYYNGRYNVSGAVTSINILQTLSPNSQVSLYGI